MRSTICVLLLVCLSLSLNHQPVDGNLEDANEREFHDRKFNISSGFKCLSLNAIKRDELKIPINHSFNDSMTFIRQELNVLTGAFNKLADAVSSLLLNNFFYS